MVTGYALIIFEHVGHFGSLLAIFGNFGNFWTLGPLVMTDILYVGQFGHFWVTSETLDNCALVKSKFDFSFGLYEQDTYKFMRINHEDYVGI